VAEDVVGLFESAQVDVVDRGVAQDRLERFFQQVSVVVFDAGELSVERRSGGLSEDQVKPIVGECDAAVGADLEHTDRHRVGQTTEQLLACP
jgi:hypothetical protein